MKDEETERYLVTFYMMSGNLVQFTCSEFESIPNKEDGTLRGYRAIDVEAVGTDYGEGYPMHINCARVEAVVVATVPSGGAE